MSPGHYVLCTVITDDYGRQFQAPCAEASAYAWLRGLMFWNDGMVDPDMYAKVYEETQQ